jgi:cation diffusion facilitator family transporter
VKEKPIAVYGALAANLLIAATKLIAAAASGSSAMLSEGIHSVVDTANELLLLLGVHRSKKPADEAHPYGHGKEIYFWGLIVAMVLFGVGGGLSVYEGIADIAARHWLADPTWNFVIIGCAFVFEGTSLVIGWRQLRRARRRGSLWQALRASRDPAVFTVIAEDSAALVGLALAFFGVLLNHWRHWLWADGVASVLIGGVLGLVALLLAHESHGLLVGEAADLEIVRAVRTVANEDEAVKRVGPPLTMHLGPDNVLLSLDLQFEDALTLAQLTQAIERIERRIRELHPSVRRIFIEARALLR